MRCTPSLFAAILIGAVSLQFSIVVTMKHTLLQQVFTVKYVDDYDRVLGSHSPLGAGALPAVRMLIENSVHYHIDRTSDKEWDALLPGGGILHDGDGGPFSIAMFHQLRCLNIIRHDFIRIRDGVNGTEQYSSLSRHCLNYLRQIALCHSDMHLEAVAESSDVPDAQVYVCRDAGAIYNGVAYAQLYHTGS
ncbi:hypothetical protein OF83DRAFT_247007 [Amylostereum chailletii]|nr:hypothetical protein OF83DRAFT_247007 [Amylostereum chailletii]